MKKEHGAINITISSGTIIRTILYGLLVAGLYYFWDLFLVVLTAVVVASAIEPATKWFVRFKIPRLLAVIVIYFAVLVCAAVMLYVFIPPILDQIVSFLNVLPSYIDSATFLAPIEHNGPSILQPSIRELSANLSLTDMIGNLRSAVSGVSGGFVKVVSVVFGGIMSFMLVVILSFYLAVQKDGVENFLKIISPVSYQKYVIDLWSRAQYKIGLWMQGQLFLALLIGLFVYIGLLILGMTYAPFILKYALFLAILAGIFELVPVFGPILAAVPAVLIGFVDGGVAIGLIIVAIYLIIQQFENQLIYPLVVRKVVGVPPLMVILALIIGARIAGFLGILLSVPITAAFLEYLSDVQKNKAAVAEHNLHKKADS